MDTDLSKSRNIADSSTIISLDPDDGGLGVATYGAVNVGAGRVAEVHAVVGFLCDHGPALLTHHCWGRDVYLVSIHLHIHRTLLLLIHGLVLNNNIHRNIQHSATVRIIA